MLQNLMCSHSAFQMSVSISNVPFMTLQLGLTFRFILHSCLDISFDMVLYKYNVFCFNSQNILLWSQYFMSFMTGFQLPGNHHIQEPLCLCSSKLCGLMLHNALVHCVGWVHFKVCITTVQLTVSRLCIGYKMRFKDYWIYTAEGVSLSVSSFLISPFFWRCQPRFLSDCQSYCRLSSSIFSCSAQILIHIVIQLLCPDFFLELSYLSIIPLLISAQVTKLSF